MVTRDFDAMLAERAGVRPTFRLAGQVFTVKAKLPHKKFKNLLATLAGDDADENKAEEDFFRLCLVPQDRERFFLLLDFDGEGDQVDEWTVVSPDQVSALIEWLMELYTGKQMPSSASSSAGSSNTGTAPNVVSLNSRTQAG